MILRRMYSPTSIIHRAITGVLAAAVVIAMAGCADRNDTDTLDSDTLDVPPRDTVGMMGERMGMDNDTTEVRLTEFAIEMPNTISGGSVIFKVTNEGTEEHNFEIEGQGIEEEFSSNLEPGDTEVMTLDLEPGTYTVYCPVGDHRQQGMQVQITVREDRPTARAY